MAILGTTFLLVTVGTLWYTLGWWKGFVQSPKTARSLQAELGHIAVLVAVYGVIITATYVFVGIGINAGVSPLQVYVLVWVLAATTHIHSALYEQRTWRSVVAAVGMQALIIFGSGMIISNWP